MLSHLECARCATTHDSTVLQDRCTCGGTLLARYDLSDLDWDAVRHRRHGMWRYQELLPPGPFVSLGEVETPVVALTHLDGQVWVKDDGVLPGGTFKARGAALGISRAMALGARAVVLPSAGNAGGAWALYGARAGLPVTVVMARTAPQVAQDEVVLAGAALELVDGTLADAGRRAREIAAESGAFLAATFGEPYRLEGKKTAWLEVFDQMGEPGSIVFPVGGGVGLVSAHKAFSELQDLGLVDRMPTLIAAQSAECAPIVAAYEAQADAADAWPGEPTTAAAGLRVTTPGESDLVLRCIRETNGTCVAVDEVDRVETVSLVARTNGVWLCPEGGVAMAAAFRLLTELRSPVVVYNTACGPKY